MPLTGEAKRRHNIKNSRKRRRKLRRKLRAERIRETVETSEQIAGPELFTGQKGLAAAFPVPAWPRNPAKALADWAESRLVVPAGRLRGKRFHIPNRQREFLSDMFEPDTQDAWLTCARKNGKSGIPIFAKD